MDTRTKRKLATVYYSPKGYWKGEGAVKKLVHETRVSEKIVKEWLSKQALWQIYLPSPRYIPRPTSVNSDEAVPNDMHEADLLFLPHDTVRRKTYRYALTVVDVASRYKEAEPLTSKEAAQVAAGFEKIYNRSPLKYPKVIKVDPGKEFMGKVNELMQNHNVTIQRGEVGNHRAQAIVERFNRTLAERLFGHQYAQEMLKQSERSTEWVKRLPAVISALNNEVTRLTKLKPVLAIKMKSVPQTPSLPRHHKELVIPMQAKVRYLYAPGEAENDVRRRATDPIWSIKSYQIKQYTKSDNQPVLYYLDGGPKRSFVREELMIIPPDTELPPQKITL